MRQYKDIPDELIGEEIFIYGRSGIPNKIEDDYDTENDLFLYAAEKIMKYTDDIVSFGIKSDVENKNAVIILKNYNVIEKFMKYDIIINAIDSCLRHYKKYDILLFNMSDRKLFDATNSSIDFKTKFNFSEKYKSGIEKINTSKRVDYLRNKKLK